MNLTVFYFTNSGYDGVNKDTILVNNTVIQEKYLKETKTIQAKLLIFAVADGIGRYKNSSLASREVLIKLSEYGFSVKNLYRIQEEFTLDGYKYTNRLGSGTTLSGIYFDKNIAKIFHVGDSRIYLIREHNVSQITTDHTQANLLLSRYTTKNLASIYSMLMNYYVYGENEEFFVEAKEIEVQNDDKFFICTDGVVDEIENLEKKLIHFNEKDFIVRKSTDDYSFIHITVNKI